MRLPVLAVLASLLPVLFCDGLVSPSATNQAVSPDVMKPIATEQTCHVSEPIHEVRAGLKTWYVNADRTIWAHFWTSEPLKAAPHDYKVLWIRPKPFPDVPFGEAARLLASGQLGTEFIVSGTRLDSTAPPLKYSIPSVYPQQLQASDVSFPTAGCWEVNARAGAASLRFVVDVR
jgi:hypothetical protein